MRIRGHNQQAEEIATIKDRTYTLKLSDADVKRIYDRAIIEGTTVEELLTDFIGNLVDGTYSRGSDERRLANEYVDRCIYRFDDDPESFIRYLLINGDVHDLALRLDILEDAKEENDVEEIAYQEREIKAWYSEYQSYGGKESYEEAFKGFDEYRKYLKERGISL